MTGASSGIGRETAYLLSKLGASIVISGRDNLRLQETRALMQGSNHRIEVFDVKDAEQIPGWVRRITDETGPLHGLVHSAGIQKTIPLRSTSTASIEEILRAGPLFSRPHSNYAEVS